MKNKGSALVKFFIVLAIVGVTGSLFFAAWTTDLKRYEEITKDTKYIDNALKHLSVLLLKQHKDGGLWACDTKFKECYKVDRIK